MTIRRRHLVAALLALAVATPFADQIPEGQGQPTQGQTLGRGGQRQQQNRDNTPGSPAPPATAAIGGRVMTADTGRPVKRARVIVSAGGRGSHSTVTDDQGRYSVTGLTAGSYTVTGSKNGFVDSIFGQKRPLQPGTPVVLTDAQALTNIDVRLIKGGVITGRIVDEDGEALSRALVTVQRYQYVRGERQLTPAGGDLSDDRGQYRVFALPPGDYYVSATAGGTDQAISAALNQLAAGLAGAIPGGLGAVGFGAGGRGGRGGGPFGAAADPEPSGFAPTYYPGVISVAEAGKVTVAAGQEVAGMDFQVQVVPFATVSGIVAGADDVAQVMLVPQGESGPSLLGGQVLRGRSQADGTFSVRNVPPGRYLAIARSGGRDDQRTGTQSINVAGQNLTGVTLMLVSGVSISGNITVESSGTPAPTDYSTFRIDVPDVDPLPSAGGGGRGGRGGGNATGARADKNGSFEIDGLQPGRHYITVTGQGGGGQGRGGAPATGGQWTLKSVAIAGRDVTDQPFELKGGEDTGTVTVVLTDRATDLSGTVRDAQGSGIEGLTVIVFSTDPQFWRSQSRKIQTSRTGATGAYRIRNLPPGDYQILTVDDVETGEWYDPAYLQKALDKSAHLSIEEGEKKTLDLRGPAS